MEFALIGRHEFIRYRRLVTMYTFLQARCQVTNRRAHEGDFLCVCSAVLVGLLADLNALLERELLNFCTTFCLNGNFSSSSSSKKLPVGHAGLVATNVDEEESLVLSTAFLPDTGDSKTMSTVSPDQREGGWSEMLVCCVEDALVVRMRGEVWGRLGEEVGEEEMFAAGWRRTDMQESERERSEDASEEVRGRCWLLV